MSSTRTLSKFFLFIVIGQLIPANLLSLILAGYISHKFTSMGVLNRTWKPFLSSLLVFFLLFRTILSKDIPASTYDDVDKKSTFTQIPKEGDGPVILDSDCVLSLLNTYNVSKLLHGLVMVIGWLVEIFTVYYIGRALKSFREKGGSLINQVVVFLLGFWLLCRFNLIFLTILKKSMPIFPIPPNITWDVSEPWTPHILYTSMKSVFCFRMFCISLIILCLGCILLIFYKNTMKWSSTITLSQVAINFFWMFFACNCILCYIGFLNEKQMNIFGRMMEASDEGKPMTETKKCDAFWQVCPLTAIDEAGEITINGTITEPFQNIGISLKIVVNKLEELFYG